MPFQNNATTMKPASLTPRPYLGRNVTDPAPCTVFVNVAAVVVGFDDVSAISFPCPVTAAYMPAPPTTRNISGMRPNQRSAVGPRSITASPGSAGLTQQSVSVPGLRRLTIAALPRYPLDDMLENWYRRPT